MLLKSFASPFIREGVGPIYERQWCYGRGFSGANNNARFVFPYNTDRKDGHSELSLFFLSAALRFGLQELFFTLEFAGAEILFGGKAGRRKAKSTSFTAFRTLGIGTINYQI